MNHIFMGWKDLSRDDVYRITVGNSNLAFVRENILINVLYNLYCFFKQMNQINLGWHYGTAMSEGFAYIIFVWPCLRQLSLLDRRSWYIVINFTISYRRDLYYTEKMNCCLVLFILSDWRLWLLCFFYDQYS